jgi:hypothetical protein
VQEINTNNPANIDPIENFVLIIDFFYSMQTMYRLGNFKPYYSS